MPSHFTWFDLMTPDVPAALEFYTGAFGHTTSKWGPSGDYDMLASGAESFGGVMKLPEEARAMGAPPHWIGYVSVADLDATCAKIRELGGKILMQHEMPEVGRIGIATDPQGATIGLFQGKPGSESKPVAAMAWHEYLAADPAAALAFYGEVFGWVAAGSMEMGGGMGTYHMFGSSPEAAFGGIMKKPAEVPVAAWLHYHRVDDTDARTKAAEARGARTVVPPMEVPGGGRIACFLDPQGASTAIFSGAM